MPLFQSESKCETILMKMSLICMKMKLHAELIFHKKGFALRLVLKQRHKGIRKWPIATRPKLCCTLMSYSDLTLFGRESSGFKITTTHYDDKKPQQSGTSQTRCQIKRENKIKARQCVSPHQHPVSHSKWLNK